VVQQVQPEAWKSAVLEPTILEKMKVYLRKVVKQGSASVVDIDGLDICGKTGTAQVGTDNERDIAWFLGFTTKGDTPRLVCVTVDSSAEDEDKRYAIAKPLFEDLVEEPVT
jgi:cell division protein FtsI/penicillin-binding protein 2